VELNPRTQEMLLKFHASELCKAAAWSLNYARVSV